ncbi:MAG: hydroxyacid dehydrogenase [Acidisphaera sp.]|nr:hydroxyacid dehydrogenase [Acidisphaera sp.]
MTRIGLACNAATQARCLHDAVRARVEALGAFVVETFDRPSSWDEPPPEDAETRRRFVAFARDLDLVMISHGAPRIDGAILDAAPRLRFVGELEGDRFARRIDVDAAARRGVKVVDTTHGSSTPVAEWALAMMMIGLRNAGSLFRRMIAGEIITQESKRADPGYLRGELTGKRVGLIACGHIGRRLLELLEPFRCDVLIHDPHLPRLIADIYDVTLTSLDAVLSRSDVVVCLAPLTPETRGMIGRRELDLLRAGAVLVNVSRGAVVDSQALIVRLQRGDIIACLDVFDPEPVPADSPVRTMPNVFLTPHIAGVTADCGPRFVDLMVDEMRRFLEGHETRHDLRPR